MQAEMNHLTQLSQTREEFTRRSLLPFLTKFGVFLVFLLSFLNPSPSSGLDIFERIVFWSLHTGLPFGICYFIQRVIFIRLPSSITIWPAVFLAAFAGTAIFAPIALALDIVFAEFRNIVQPEEFGLEEVFDEWLHMAPSVAMVWIAANGALVRRFPPTIQPPTSVLPARPAMPPFMELMPSGLRGSLVAISAELHYLRVYTTLGDALILYGFGAALADLGPDCGLQIHRSHWVNPDFVTEVTCHRGHAKVRLSNGIELPIARVRRTQVLQFLKSREA